MTVLDRPPRGGVPASTPAAALPAETLWALAMRQGMLTDGWTMADVRTRYAELLGVNGHETAGSVTR